jgi:hypothetical protein
MAPTARRGIKSTKHRGPNGSISKLLLAIDHAITTHFHTQPYIKMATTSDTKRTFDMEVASFLRYCPVLDCEVIYNFAFGSNLLMEKVTSRGMKPLLVEPGILNGWTLTFDLVGFPPLEPTFGNIARNPKLETHGAVYALTVDDFKTLWAGEGSGDWYFSEKVSVCTYGGRNVDNCLIFCALPSKLSADGLSHPPSLRYMN